MTDKHTKENNYIRKLTQRAINNNYMVDWYDIDSMWPLENSALIHGRKKLSAPGGRSGGKSYIQDIEESIWSLQEGLKLLKEKQTK